MKTVTYRHDWGSNLNTEDEMVEKFGKLLVDINTSEDYQQETSSLFYNPKTRKYTWIDSNGCSCWDGDYDGWELTKEEMLTIAKKKVENKRDWREAAEDIVAQWIVDHRK